MTPKTSQKMTDAHPGKSPSNAAIVGTGTRVGSGIMDN